MDKRILKPYLGKETLTDNGNTESLSIDNKMSIINLSDITLREESSLDKSDLMLSDSL